MEYKENRAYHSFMLPPQWYRFILSHPHVRCIDLWNTYWSYPGLDLGGNGLGRKAQTLLYPATTKNYSGKIQGVYKPAKRCNLSCVSWVCLWGSSWRAFLKHLPRHLGGILRAMALLQAPTQSLLTINDHSNLHKPVNWANASIFIFLVNKTLRHFNSTWGGNSSLTRCGQSPLFWLRTMASGIE